MTFLNVSGLGRSFGPRKALVDINLQLDAGDRVALLGPNGAGKTTLLKIIGGALAPDVGRVTVANLSPGEARRRPGLLGWLPERAPLNPDLTVEEHLKITAAFLELSKAKTRERIGFLTEALSLKTKLPRLAGQLSLGSRRQAALAIALLGEPRLLILDEPTISLDPEEVARLRNLLKSFSPEVCFLISSHVIAEVAKVTDQAIILYNGHLIAQKSWLELGPDYEIGYLKETNERADH
ncbi:MAG: ABC transporter ATP-binding protein [Deltaproteobacteria bacterium]|jgi:ABC-2 type transport system ATP-binding protein|nr:ABC transporter ATP-binding protein [Deltaproteobacteria bacterium]